MNVTKVTLNETLDADRFKLTAPAGVEVMHLGETGEAKKP